MKKNSMRRALAALATCVLATCVLAAGVASGSAHASPLSPESGQALATGDTGTGQTCSTQNVCAAPSDPEDGIFTIQTATTGDTEIIEYSLVVTLFDPALGDGTAIPTDDFEYWMPEDDDPEYGPLLPWGECLTDPENIVCPLGDPTSPQGQIPEPGTLACMFAALVGAGISARRRPVRA